MNIVVVRESASTRLDIREITQMFSFPKIYIPNLEIASNPRNEQNAQIYGKFSKSSFRHKPTSDKIKWWIKEQYNFILMITIFIMLTGIQKWRDRDNKTLNFLMMMLNILMYMKKFWR